jgi:predicted metalloprotease
VLSPLASALRLASIVVCLIVIVSFALFVINQTGSASAHQQQELNGTTTAPGTQAAQGGATSAKHAKKSSLRTSIDDVSEAITSPFDGLSSGWSSQWLIRGVNLLLALLVYGFGLGFLARVIRVRA